MPNMGDFAFFGQQQMTAAPVLGANVDPGTFC